MATHRSLPALSDKSDWELMEQESSLKIREAELTLGLAVSPTTDESFLKSMQAFGLKPRIAQLHLEIEDIPELTGTIPIRLDNWEMSAFESFRFTSDWMQINLSFKGMDWKPSSSTTLTDSQLLSIARDVSDSIPENLPNREFMQKLAIAAATKGAKLMAQSLQVHGGV